MLSPVTTSSPAILAALLADRGPRIATALPGEAGSTAASSLTEAARVEIGAESGATPLSNYGLPREVVIARASATAETGDDPRSPASEDTPWTLSIASRYIGAYATTGKAASAALNMLA